MASIDTAHPSSARARTATARIPAPISAIVDMVAVLVSAGIAFVAITMIYSLVGLSYETPTRLMMERAWPLATVVLCLGVWFFLHGHYHRRTPFWSDAREVLQASVLALLVEGFLLYSGRADVSRLLTSATWMLAPFVIMTFRHILKATARRFGIGVSRVLIIGHDAHIRDAQSFLKADRHLGYEISGCMCPGSIDEISARIASTGADEVLFALSGNDDQEGALAADMRLAGFSVMVMPPKMGLPAGLGVQYVLGEEALLFVERADSVPGLARAAKRAFDIIIATTVLLAATVPMLVIALLVRIDGGPAIFGHARVGKGGRMFDCLKFRSMRVDAQEQLDALLAADPVARQEWDSTRKLKNDPRITCVGSIIRKTGLDELPQLVNVIRGDMSLVGPRPVTVSEMEQYGEVGERYKRVRPGITGLWQVSGRNDTTYAQRVSLDAWYVANWSPWHDLVILLKTVPAVLFRRGAY